MVLGAACRQQSSAPAEVPPLPAPAPEVARQVTLELSAREAVGVGEHLDLRVRARNESEVPVTLVRPMYGSWEDAREPRYVLDWTDEHGTSVRDPLGFAPGISCGTMDLPDDDDRIAVAPGATVDLVGSSDARQQHDVLVSARPGRYSLRVHYTAQAVGGATPLELWSAAVPVEITDGDAALWQCRADQLARRDDHEYAHASWGNFVTTADGRIWLITSRYVHRVENGTADPRGEIWVRPFDAMLRPLDDATRVVQSDDEMGWVSAVAVADSVIVVATPGPVGRRRVEAHALDLGSTPSARPPVVLQAAPGNPYVTRLLAVGDEVLVFHEGDEAHEDTLMVTRVDAHGRPQGAARPLAREVHGFRPIIGPDGPMIAWLQRGSEHGAVVQSLDAEGRARGAPLRLPLDPGHSLLAVTRRPGELQLAYADRSTRGDDPTDLMGVFVQRYSDDGALKGPAQAMGPTAKWAHAFGDVAWSGERLGRLVAQEHELLAGPARGRLTPLSTTASGDPRLTGHATGFWAMWSDTRDDDSLACVRLQQCTPEYYGAVMAPDGSVRSGPLRLTELAIPEPFVPNDDDWLSHCRDPRLRRGPAPSDGSGA